MKNMQKKLLAVLMMIVLSLSAALPAFADDRTNDTFYYGGTGQDTIYEATPLPNGNLLLNGYTQLGRNGREQVSGSPRQTRAWLLCLAPDGSILWEALDETEGTTRYVAPVITSGGDIAVLFYNSPSQVNTEIAIHLYSMEGQLKEKVALPLEVGLVEGVMTDGYVFYDWEKGYIAADLTGTVRGLEIGEEERITGSGVADMIPYGDGWIIAGQRRNEPLEENLVGFADKKATFSYSIVHFDRDGKTVWRYDAPEDALLYNPVLADDGSILCNWRKWNEETGEVTESHMICLDGNGQLQWQVDIPSKVCGNFAPVEDGFVFYRKWMEKTYTFIEFTLIGRDGQVKQQWQAEKRREMLYGAEMFAWNGEAWFHADAEREKNRINDRQEDLELEDCSLIRVIDCQPVAAQ